MENFYKLSGRQDSNLRPPAPKAGAMDRTTLRPDYTLVIVVHNHLTRQEQERQIYFFKQIAFFYFLIIKIKFLKQKTSQCFWG